MKNLNVSGLRLLSLLTIVGLTVNAFGQSEELWNSAFQKNIKWQQLAPTGHLVVSTDASLIGIDPATGKEMWRREDLKGLLEASEGFKNWLEQFVPYSPYLLVRTFSGAKKKFKHSGMHYDINLIDILTGKTVWTTEAMKLKGLYRYVMLPKIGGMLIYAKDQNKKKTVFAVDLFTGAVLWENAQLFEEGEDATNSQPFFDSDTTMIAFLTKKPVCKFNAKTGELLWETDTKGKKRFSSILPDDNADVIYAASEKYVHALNTADGSLPWGKATKVKKHVKGLKLTTQGLVIRGDSYLNVLDLATGQPLWKKPFKKNVWQMSEVAAGLVVKSEGFINLLDLATGQSLWKKKFKKLKDATNFVLKDDKVVVYADKKLYAINLSDGVYTELAKDLKFKDKERPGRMMLRDDGYFLSSSNNLMLISFSGEKLFHTYHKAPGMSFGEKLAARAAGEAIEKLADYMGEKDWQTDVQEAHRLLGEWAPVVYLMPDESEHGDRALHNEKLQTYLDKWRYRATANLDKYIYILTHIKTETGKDVGLVKVNKVSGVTEDHLILGTKKPDYVIDEFESRLFFKADKKEIVCYKF